VCAPSSPYDQAVRLPGRTTWREVALFAFVLTVQVGGVALAAQGQDTTLRWWGVLLLATAAAAVPLRRSHPATAAWTAKLTTVLYWSLDTPRGPAFVALIVTFVNLVYVGRRWHALAIAIVGVVGFGWLGTLLADHAEPTTIGVAATVGWVAALAGAGEALRSTRDRRHANQQSEAAAVQRQIVGERLRIARDLHDVVAHNMSLINLRAGVALHLAGNADPDLQDALATIKTASKDALVELRSVLGVLRAVDDPTLLADADTQRPDPDRAPRQPTPSLVDMASLVATASDAGVEVTTHVHIDAPVPMPTQVAAYRIVQESLTNVARHARPPAATLSVTTADEMLRIEVANTTDQRSSGPTSDESHGTGNGIAGMRERATSVGGTLVAGPRLAGGFAVTAQLPLRDLE
jgi:signal transduction histidine kinase